MTLILIWGYDFWLFLLFLKIKPQIVKRSNIYLNLDFFFYRDLYKELEWNMWQLLWKTGKLSKITWKYYCYLCYWDIFSLLISLISFHHPVLMHSRLRGLKELIVNSVLIRHPYSGPNPRMCVVWTSDIHSQTYPFPLGRHYNNDTHN